MKKRLSLLMVLMMVLSLVPMSAFATAGTASNGLFTISDTDELGDTDALQTVIVKLTQAAGSQLTTGGMAKITINKGEFANTVAGTAEFGFGEADPVTQNVNRVAATKDVAYVTIPAIPAYFAGTTVGNKVTLKKEMDILLNLTVQFDAEDAGDVTLSVEEVNSSGLDVSKAIVVGVVEEATDSDMKITVKDDTKKISFDGGELSRFTLSDMDESGTTAEPTSYVDLELPDYLTWDMSKTLMSLGSSNAAVTYTYVDDTNAEVGTTAAKATNIIRVTVSGDNAADLVVVPFVNVDRRDASTGEITIDVTARNAAKKSIDSLDATIGMIADYDAAMSAVEKGKKVIPAIYGGDDTTVKVTIEGVVGSFTAGRQIDFTLEGADISSANDIVGSSTLTATTTKDYDDGEFTLTVAAADKDELTFELTIKADYAQEGMVTLTAESRDFDTLEADIASVTPAYTVSVEKATTIKKGESLATANIVIKEAKAGMFDTNQFLVLNLNDKNRDTMSFGSDYKVETTNGLDVDNDLFNSYGSTKSDLNTIVLDMTSNSSKEAGMITISDVIVSVDGAAVDGIKTLDSYLVTQGDVTLKDDGVTETGVKVSNDATAAEYALSTIADLDTDYSVDYVNVVKEYGTVATTTVFKIGSKEYTVNGETMTANEAPFIAGKGYTMLPVRALAESLGLTADWNSNTKTATFSSSAKIASVVIGSDMIYVNGTPITLNAKAEIKNGSTFVELRSLASAFGVELQWDAATKMVTIIG